MSDLEEYAGGSLREVVTNYEWIPADGTGQSYGVLIKIKVYRNSDGEFYATPSHRVKTPGQAGPYMPSGPSQNSAEEAVRFCIRGFKMFMGSASETGWFEANDV